MRIKILFASLTLLFLQAQAEELKAPPQAREEQPFAGGWEGVTPVPPPSAAAQNEHKGRAPAGEAPPEVVALPTDAFTDLTVAVTGATVRTDLALADCSKKPSVQDRDICVDAYLSSVHDDIKKARETYRHRPDR